MIELELVGVRVELPANQPIILLKERNGSRYLPIWIGATEAAAIAFALQGVETPRPLTHDLFVDVLGSLNVDLAAVHITDLQDGTYYAELQLTQNGSVHAVSARPSDAIALASRLDDVVILGEDAVLDEAGIEIADEDIGDGEDPEEEVQRFRDFLDTVTPEDFKNA
ncbi:MAG: bifunctional nuclease family protein [Nitriliruptorales bacterium]|nr:bifunctional nuclease family protein [Nitriliruptorales bacterium]